MRNWRHDLDHFFKKQEETHVQHNQKQQEQQQMAKVFIIEKAIPALEQVKEELVSKYGRTVSIHKTEDTASITIENEGTRELDLTVLVRGNVPNYEVRAVDEKGARYKAENMIMSSSDFPIEQITTEHIIEAIIQQYKIGASHGTHYSIE